MPTSSHVAVVRPAVLVHVFPYTRRQTLRFSARRQQAHGTWLAAHSSQPRGTAQRTIQSLQCLTEGPTRQANASATGAPESRCGEKRAASQSHVATYICLERRMRYVGIVGQVRRRRQRPQRALAGSGHGVVVAVVVGVVLYMARSQQQRVPSKEGGGRNPAGWQVVPRPRVLDGRQTAGARVRGRGFLACPPRLPSSLAPPSPANDCPPAATPARHRPSAICHLPSVNRPTQRPAASNHCLVFAPPPCAQQ
jgi:hypothetical protein